MRAPIRSAVVHVPDAPGGVDAPDSSVSRDPPQAPARSQHSASRVRSRVIAPPFPAPRPHPSSSIAERVLDQPPSPRGDVTKQATRTSQFGTPLGPSVGQRQAQLHVVQQALHPRVAQVAEQPHAMHANHRRKRVRPATATGLRIERLDTRLQPAVPTESARPSCQGTPRAASDASSNRVPAPRRSTVPSLARHDVTSFLIMTESTCSDLP